MTADVPLASKVELLVFLLDGSGSMCIEEYGGKDTFDGRTKGEHLQELVRGSLTKLIETKKNFVFRISFIYFAGQATTFETQENGTKIKWFKSKEALDFLKNPCDVAQGDGTSITRAFESAKILLDEFYEAKAKNILPEETPVTIFLFSDGQETMTSRDDCIKQINNILTHPLGPSLATISFGNQADIDLLREVASEAQEKHELAIYLDPKLSKYMENEQGEVKKLFLRGTDKNILTEDLYTIVRRFVDTLSQSTPKRA